MADLLNTTWILPIIVAIITSAASIIVGFINYLNSRKTDEKKENHETRLKNLENENAIQKSKHDARQEYEYKAMMRLYEEFDPYLFQYLELCENALQCILKLAKWSREGRLKQYLTMGIRGSNMRKTVYDLFAPLATFTIFRNKLTLLDISLVPVIKYQYIVAKTIFYLFDDDREFAKMEPPITTYPYQDADTITLKGKQGFDVRSIEIMAKSLIFRPNDPNDKPRTISYNEFIDKCENEEFKEIVKPIFDKLSAFTPDSQPIFWRMMISQSLLYRSLENSNKPEFSKYFEQLNPKANNPFTFEVFKKMSKIDPNYFDWCKREEEHTKNDPDPFKAVDSYLKDKLRNLFEDDEANAIS